MNKQKVKKGIKIKFEHLMVMITIGLMVIVYGLRVVSGITGANFSEDGAIVKLIPTISLAVSLLVLVISVFLFRNKKSFTILALLTIVISSGIYQVIKLDLILLILPIISLFFVAIVLEDFNTETPGEEKLNM